MNTGSDNNSHRISFIVFIILFFASELIAGALAYSDYSNTDSSYSGLYTYIFDMLLIPALLGLLRGIVENIGQRLITAVKGTKSIFFALLKLLCFLALHSLLCQIISETAYCIATDSEFVFSVYESLIIFRYSIGIGLAVFILTCVAALLIPIKQKTYTADE